MRRRGRKTRGTLQSLLPGLSAPFLTDAYAVTGQTGGAGVKSTPRTDQYTFDDTQTVYDWQGNVEELPKHYLASHGTAQFYNLFAKEGVDWTDTSNWTEATASIAQASADEMTLSGLTTSGAVWCQIGVLASDSVVDRVASGIVLVKADKAENVGKDVVVRVIRTSGGSATNSAQNITLTDEYQAIDTGSITGASSNQGFSLRIGGSATDAADGCTIKNPALIEWRTGYNTSNPPLPSDVQCYTPRGANLLEGVTPTVGSNWTDNGDGSYTATAAGAFDRVDFDGVGLVEGQTYTFEMTVDEVVAGNVDGTIPGTGAAEFDDIAVAGTYYTTVVAGATDTVRFERGGSDFTGTISGLRVYEATNGFYASDRVPANTVSSGVITEGTGARLIPVVNRTIPTDNGRTITFPDARRTSLWKASEAYSVGDCVLAVDHETNFNRELYFEVTSAGTSNSSEPTWPTSIGGTVVDSGVTWEAKGYHTIRGVPIEPATTQDMAEAAVLATGGSASTFPTSWQEIDPDSIISVVGEGVSPLNPSARYIDVRCNNGTGGAVSTAGIVFDPTSTTGITQGDDITQSVWLQITAGTLAGNVEFEVNERGSGDSFLANTAGDDITPDGNLKRYASTITVANASTDRYRRIFRFSSIPDGTDFTIRITLPNSCQQSFATMPILDAATRTTQQGALKYSDANYDDDSWLCVARWGLGVAQNDVTFFAGITSVNSSAVSRGIYVNSNGDIRASDGTSTAVIADYGDAANVTQIAALSIDSAASNMALYQQSAGTARSDATTAYDGSLDNNGNIIVGQTVSLPVVLKSLIAIPRGSIETVGIGSILDDD